MAKVNRSMLKSIVKECLVELLAEGLSEGGSQDLSESFSHSKKTRIKSPKNVAVKSNDQNSIANPRFEEKTKQLISNATKDPIMASILEDTAGTTLQEQNGADRPNKFTAKPSDTYSQIASEGDPMEMFEGVSNNWAALAFADK